MIAQVPYQSRPDFIRSLTPDHPNARWNLRTVPCTPTRSSSDRRLVEKLLFRREAHAPRHLRQRVGRLRPAALTWPHLQAVTVDLALSRLTSRAGIANVRDRRARRELQAIAAQLVTLRHAALLHSVAGEGATMSRTAATLRTLGVVPSLDDHNQESMCRGYSEIAQPNGPAALRRRPWCGRGPRPRLVE